MDVRTAESDDTDRIRAIASDSLQSSYALSPQQIEKILEEEFDDTSLADLMDDGETAVLVVEGTIDGTEAVFGFITVEMGAEATIRWLHVDPEARGEGMATMLLERVHEETEKPIEASILEDAVEGGEFLEEFGLEQSGNDEISVGGDELAVTIFSEGGGTETANEPSVPIPESVTVDGDDHPVDREDSVPGRDAPFFTVYATESGGETYGYFCSECGSTDVSADGLDRLECGECGNTHKADEWDDAYL